MPYESPVVGLTAYTREGLGLDRCAAEYALKMFSANGQLVTRFARMFGSQRTSATAAASGALDASAEDRTGDFEVDGASEGTLTVVVLPQPHSKRIDTINAERTQITALQYRVIMLAN